jgi:hypothetical protein
MEISIFLKREKPQVPNEPENDPLKRLFDTPSGSLEEGAVIMNEWFKSLVGAGFTKKEALRFMAYMMKEEN